MVIMLIADHLVIADAGFMLGKRVRVESKGRNTGAQRCSAYIIVIKSILRSAVPAF